MIPKNLWLKASFLLVVLFFLLPTTVFSQTQITVSDFTVLDWFRAVKLTWNASAREGAQGVFEIYRSDKEKGPYILVQEIQLGDKQFIDVITKTYLFLDKKVETGHRYYYKLALRGTDQTFGPFQGLATGSIGT